MMPKNPERPLAAHVQAAIQQRAGATAKQPAIQQSTLAAHLAAAIAATAQPKMTGPAGQDQKLATQGMSGDRLRVYLGQGTPQGFRSPAERGGTRSSPFTSSNSERGGARMGGDHHGSAPCDLLGVRRPSLAIQPSQVTYGPSPIDLSDLETYAPDYDLEIIRSGKEEFIGTTSGKKILYPHIHVHSNGTIAISVGKSTNINIGKDGNIPYDSLYVGVSRVQQWGTNRLGEMLRWFLMVSN